MSKILEDKGLSRLDFLKASGALVIAFSLPITFKSAAADAAASTGKFPPVNAGQLDSWLAIAHDGTVTLFTGKVELGGGVVTGLSQIVAEELDVPVEKFHVVQGDTLRTPNQGYTVGSTTIASAGPVLAQMAADARYALLEKASSHLGAPASALSVKNGVVSVNGKKGKSISYAELVGGKRFDSAIPAKDEGFAGIVIGGKGKPKKYSQYRVVGQSVPRLDIPDKVTGSFTFVHDVRIPGMLHGRVIRPTGIGSHLISHGKAPAGVQIVREKDFLGVVAEDEWTAIQAAQNLDVKWSDWKGLPAQADLYTTLRKTPSVNQTIAHTGNTKEALAHAAKTIRASYMTPVESHASLGPSCAIAEVKGDTATIWAGTQGPSLLQANIAQLLNLKPENVRVIYYEAAGCYGRNGADPVAIDAALMSKLTGKAVRVQWMRWDEHVWDPKGPPTVQDLVGGLDAKNQIVAWDHEAWMPGNYATTIIGSIQAGRPVGIPSVGGFIGPMLYDFPAYQQVQHGESEVRALGNNQHGIITAWLRSPGQFQVTFAMESFVDELAHAVGMDPLQFRLTHLKEARLVALVKAVAKAAGWQTRVSPKPDATTGKATIATGRGVALSQRDGTYNVGVSEVEVNRNTGQVTVTRIVMGQDNGMTVNPRAVKLHIEGAVTQSVSRALLEEVTFNESNVTSSDWNSYPILTFKEAPVIETVLINHPELPATGVGEPSCNPVPPSIANAIFDAVGVRVRQLPFRAATVKAAMQAAEAASKKK